MFVAGYSRQLQTFCTTVVSLRFRNSIFGLVFVQAVCIEQRCGKLGLHAAIGDCSLLILIG
jgi:hypothetical protein